MLKFVCFLVLLAESFVGYVECKTCWDSTWFNTSMPSLHGGSEFEHQNTTVLDHICPDGDPVTDAHCKDSRGEPFRGFKNDSANHYVASCNVTDGLICHPYSTVTGAKCADFAIQYGCNCPTTTTVSTTSASSSNLGSSRMTVAASNRNSPVSVTASNKSPHASFTRANRNAGATLHHISLVETFVFKICFFGSVLCLALM